MGVRWGKPLQYLFHQKFISFCFPLSCSFIMRASTTIAPEIKAKGRTLNSEGNILKPIPLLFFFLFPNLSAKNSGFYVILVV